MKPVRRMSNRQRYKLLRKLSEKNLEPDRFFSAEPLVDDLRLSKMRLDNAGHHKPKNEA